MLARLCDAIERTVYLVVGPERSADDEGGGVVPSSHPREDTPSGFQGLEEPSRGRNRGNTRRSRRRRGEGCWTPCRQELERAAHYACAHGASTVRGGGLRHGIAMAVALADAILVDQRDYKNNSLNPGTQLHDTHIHVTGSQHKQAVERNNAQAARRKHSNLLVDSKGSRKEVGDCCPICFEVMHDAVSLGCSCSTVFCRACIKRVHSCGHTEIGRRRLCPLCRGPAVALVPVPTHKPSHMSRQGQENRAVLARKFEQLLKAASDEADGARHSLMVQAALVLVTLAYESRDPAHSSCGHSL